MIIHGANFIYDGERQREFDFILISGSRKLIITIECKFSFTYMVFEQVSCHEVICEENFGDQLDDEWQHIPVIFVYDERTMPYHDLTDKQRRYVLSGKENISAWVQDIDENFPRTYVGHKSAEQMKNIVKLLIFTYHISTPSLSAVGAITPSKIVKETTKAISTVSTLYNITFSTSKQLPVMESKDPKYNNIVFPLWYGNGHVESAAVPSS